MVDEVETQRENIFHSRCHILSNLCSIIIYGGSCVNVASERLVRKLALPTLWPSEHGGLNVNRQIEVAFTLGRYEDKVLCYVVQMEATHLLLGRSWQFDRKVTHDGVTNRFIFVHMGPKVVRKPLSPRAKGEKSKSVKKVGIKYPTKSGKSNREEKSMKDLLKEFKDEFPKDIPPRLPPYIEHHIDLSLEVTLLNKAAYKTNPEEGKEIQKHVGKLLEKGWVKEHEPICHACDPGAYERWHLENVY
ncbi:hypothetical protein CR513_38326, partial [Mucuna pruriens]